jgi:hypothetical protein
MGAMLVLGSLMIPFCHDMKGYFVKHKNVGMCQKFLPAAAVVVAVGRCVINPRKEPFSEDKRSDMKVII